MRKFAIVALIALLSAGVIIGVSHIAHKNRVSLDDVTVVAFESWLARQNKVYNSPAEKAYRRTVFASNYFKVEQMNKVMTHESELNDFADLTLEEFKRRYTGLSKETPKDEGNVVYLDTNDISNNAIDWRNRGAVQSVKNQRSCGSCWAFSATSTVESAYEIQSGKLLDLSEQQLVDCGGATGNDGCNGGWPQWAFSYIMQAGGQMKQSDYPYTAKDGSCKFAASKVHVKLHQWSQVPHNDCSQLHAAIKKNPVSVALNADGMMFYKHGIFSDSSCSTQMDHAVVADGFGRENGVNYWIVRNSWGKNWGESGYIRMSRDVKSKAGICGICQKAAYPIVA